MTTKLFYGIKAWLKKSVRINATVEISIFNVRIISYPANKEKSAIYHCYLP